MSSNLELLMIAGIISVIVLAIIILMATRNRSPKILASDSIQKDKNESERDIEHAIAHPTVTSSVFASVSKSDLQKAEEDLRILSVEKEIVSYALTRLFEAQAEGRITEKDKDKLLGKYKVEMTGLEKQMNDKQMVVRLHELESTQADLVKLFQDKFEEITRNIDNIRSSLGISQPPSSEQLETFEPKKEEQAKEKSKDPSEEEKEDSTEETKEKASPKPRVPQKSRAEEKVEAIQQEVLKILERLEKQDLESE